VVNTYSAPMHRVASRIARGMTRRGFLASSASGAAPSNPPKARIVYTEPAITPVRPWNCPAGVYFVVNTLSVLLLPAWKIKKIARTRKTPISNMPRTVPSRADVRMP
jgi:hypothetical protein